MIRSLLAFACIAPSLLPAQQTAPQPNRPDPEQVFKRVDKNGDGKITQDELPPERRQTFARQDANGDGGISLAELKAVLEAGARRNAGKSAASAGKGKGAMPLPDTVIAKRDLAYAGSDNPRQKLDLYLPRNPASASLPLVVFIHGGGWRAGDKAGGQGNLMRFVTTGLYAGASIGYRLTNESQWPAQIHDCKAAIRWLRANAKEHGFDPEKIAVWGTSAGGHLVAMLGASGGVKELEGALGSHTDTSSRVTCVVNYFGPVNFQTMVAQESTIDRTTKDYPEALLLGGRVQDVPEKAREASPVTWVSADDPPMLTAHGTKDPLVPFAQAQELDAAMKKAGAKHFLIKMTGAGHGFGSQELDKRVRQFLDLHLRGVEEDISTDPIEAAPAPRR